MSGKVTPFPNGSMHGAEIGTFTCSAGKERTLHQVTLHTVIIASDSLLTADGDERDSRAMQTVNFVDPQELGGMKLNRRCRDCTLAVWQTCRLPRRRAERTRRRIRRERHESVVFK